MERIKKEFDSLKAQILSSMTTIEGIVNTEQEKIQKELERLEKDRKETEQIIREEHELSDILDKCRVDVCFYRTALEEINKKHYGERYNDLIVNKRFHFFLSYRDDYATRQSVIEAHKEIIDAKSFCWYGKFFKQRERGGTYKELEPFGESIRSVEGSSVASSIRNKVKARIQSGESIYLYLYNPNPPNNKLHVANVVDFYFSDGTIPGQGDLEDPLQCAHMPGYYFIKGGGDCNACRQNAAEACGLKYLCNFWFKLDEIIRIDDADIPKEFINLNNCFTKDQINLAVPILYPLLVAEKDEQQHFAGPISQKIPCDIQIKKNEKGHTKVGEVEAYFKKLNAAAMNSFIKATSIRIDEASPVTKILASEKNDEVMIRVKSGFRVDGDASIVFSVKLDKKTTKKQKDKVVGLLEAQIQT